MLNKFLEQNRPKSLELFCEYIRQGIPSAVFGVNDSYKSYLISSVNRPILLVCNDYITANKFKELIKEFSDKKCVVIPPKDELLIPSRGFSKDLTYSRIAALFEAETADVIIATVETLMQTFPAKTLSVDIDKGGEYKIEEVVSTLVKLGYKRTDQTESKGAFSVRGDIIDVFPINSESPYRIDFFGDTVESIKTFDAETRKNTEYFNTVKILQAVENVLSEPETENILSLARNCVKTSHINSKAKLQTLLSDLEIAAENSDFDFTSIFAGKNNGAIFFDEYISPETVVIIDEGKKTNETAKLLYEEFDGRFLSLEQEGGVFDFQRENFLSVDALKEKFKKYPVAALSSLTSSVDFFSPLKIINPQVSGVIDYKLDFKQLFTDVKNWINGGYRVVVSTGEMRRAENITADFLKSNINAKVGLNEGGVSVTADRLETGFISHENKTAVIGSGNLYAKKVAERKIKNKKQAFFNAPEKGDYCVHETHGIGKVLGNKKITTLEGTKDYIAVEYHGGDVLYVPVEELDVLSKYIGAEKTPKLSKIGGKDFERIKGRVIDSIKKMSFDLKKLYAERNAEKGFKFSLDQEMMNIFISEFEYEDTPDQHAAFTDVVLDMTSGKVMDRLVCGDVGFGKTEVALRAVFLAVMNGKQAAMLAPTTILTEQHYSTAVKRFNKFGVKVAVLNRFKSDAEQAKILNDLKEGKIDFIIGTHRLLGKDVDFKDLGLLILDEEQRFGVEHKEKIKLMKKNVDTLTLTATPIPRTLNMSLTGIREISTINTPPKKRLPVQTYVTEESDMLIKDAVLREIGRGGQAFILYNRVETIYSFAERMKSVLPNVKITVIHGRMEEKTLENNVLSFYRGESDVLISTTIIENGVDLPKANTLIVIDADKLGLSTLYQLKGRVGRSDRLAYAYFTYKREKVLLGAAFDRLSAIVEFAEMGSGIKIAMRDLEIRGAGNVLGAEQHGHMDKIGYELYSKLLREELSGKEELPIDLDVRVTAFIPDEYIMSSSARMEAYKAIAEISSLKEEKELKETYREVYGKIPPEIENLFAVVCVKYLAKSIGVSKITVSKEETSIKFYKFEAFSNKGLSRAIDEFNGSVKIVMTGAPEIRFVNRGETNDQMLSLVKEFLRAATN